MKTNIKSLNRVHQTDCGSLD